LLYLPQTCKDMSYEARDLLINTPVQLQTYHYFEEECPGDIADLRTLGYQFGDHSAIGPIYSHHVQGHGMVILRQPEQRLLSAWSDALHSWPWAYFRRDPKDLAEFASVVGGCMAKMMTRSSISSGHGTSTRDDAPSLKGRLSEGVSSCGDPNPVTAEELYGAVSQLQGFAFVGILENYSLSICLFHAMFGGNCHQEELLETHSSYSSNTSEYDTSVLQGWTDINDRTICRRTAHVSGTLRALQRH